MARFRWSAKSSRNYTPLAEPLEHRALPSVTASALDQLPLTFEANQGQAEASVRFLAHDRDYDLALTERGAVLALRHGDQTDVLELRLLGRNATPALVGLDRQAAHVNYLRGGDPTQWQTDVSLFGRVEYQQVYPGIDLVFYGNAQQQLEYDFNLAPGADPDQIGLRFDGAQGLVVDGLGNLVIHLSGGDVVQHAPVVYTVGPEGRLPVAAQYVLGADGTVGFTLASPDATRSLVIDP